MAARASDGSTEASAADAPAAEAAPATELSIDLAVVALLATCIAFGSCLP